MKNILFLLTISAMMLGSVSGVQAQGKGKIGHINSNDLMELIPGRDSAQTQLDGFAQELQGQLGMMTSEYEKKLSDYQKHAPTMSDLIRQTKEKELQQMGERLQEFQQNAQQMLGQKEEALLKPLVDRAKKAISEVANENGYSYVFDSTPGGSLLHYPPSEDILPLVKKKLGM